MKIVAVGEWVVGMEGFCLRFLLKIILVSGIEHAINSWI